MTVITGDDSDEQFQSIRTIDQIDGGGGYDSWLGRYDDPITLTYNGHDGTVSNGTTLNNIESVTYSANSAAPSTYIISGGDVELRTSFESGILYADYSGRTLVPDDSGTEFSNRAGHAVFGGVEMLSVHLKATDASLEGLGLTDAHITLTANDDAFVYSAGIDTFETTTVRSTLFVDGGAGEDTLLVTGVSPSFPFSLTRGADGVYTLSIAPQPNESLIFGDISFTGFEHLRVGARLVELVGDATVGTPGNDTLTGRDGVNDLLSGVGGNDHLLGLGGDDILQGGTGKNIIDGGEGIDTAAYGDATAGVHVSLAATGYQKVASGVRDLLIGIENLTGSAFGDVLTGNDSNNVLDGADGNDALYGGGASDHLYGRDGNDKLDGGTGADILEGGFGDDSYYVDDSGDQIVEDDPFGGTDRVYASLDWTLADNLENLTLTGAGSIAGTGNGFDNLIKGNEGDNVLKGGAGDDNLSGGLGDDVLVGGAGLDTLVGGAGADRFQFDVLVPQMKGDVVKDFVSGTDQIALSATVFAGLRIFGSGALSEGELVHGTKAASANDRLIYNDRTGDLWYDADGSGHIGMVKIAILTGHPALDASDIVII